MPGPLRKSYKILIEGPAAAGADLTRAFLQAPLRHGTCKLLMQWPPREDPTRISTRSSVEDLERITQGPLREELSTISTRARLCENLEGKCHRPRAREPRGAKVAGACAVEMHMGISQEQFFSRIYRRNAGDQSYDDGVKHTSHLLTNQNHHETSGSGFVHPTFVSSMINSWSKLPITSPARVTEEHDPKECWEISRDTYIIIHIYMLYIYIYVCPSRLPR